MLTKQQQEHLESILRRFSERYGKKYTVGAVEHGGYLGDMSALELAYNILDEAMDQVGYAVTLIDQLESE